MTTVEKGIVIVVFCALYAVFFNYITTADLPTLVRQLDSFQPPKNPADHRHDRREPLVSLIGAGDRAVEPLVAVLGDTERPPVARIGAAIVLARLKTTSACSALVALLATTDARADAFAEEALVKIGGEAALNAIGAALRPPTPGELQVRAMAVMPRIAGQTRHANILSAVLRDSHDVAVRRGAVETLSRVKGAEPAIALGNALGDKDASVRAAAEKALVTREKKEVLAAARKLINQSDLLQRRVAVRLACQIVDLPEIKPTLERGFGDAELSIAAAAAPGLGVLVKQAPDNRDAFVKRLGVLLEKAREPEQLFELAQGAAAGEIVELRPRFRLWLGDADHGRRLAAFEALGRLGEPSEPGRLLGYLADRSPDIVEAAHRALNRLLARDRRKLPHLMVDHRTAFPAQLAPWKTWWTRQGEVFAQDAQVAGKRKQAIKLIQTRTGTGGRKAVALLESARENLIRIGELTGQEPSDRISDIQSWLRDANTNKALPD